MENENLNNTLPISGVIKTTFKWGFYGFLSLVLFYILAMAFWNSPTLYHLYGIFYIQTWVLVIFFHFSAGYFGQTAVYKKYSGQKSENPDNIDSEWDLISSSEKISYYGALSGIFTAGLIIFLPVFIITLTAFGSFGYFRTLSIALGSFVPFAIIGVICGFIGSYTALLEIKKTRLNTDESESKIQKDLLAFGLLALLILFVPLFFSFAAVHLIEPEVITYGEFDENKVSFIKTDSLGNIEWKTEPLLTTADKAFYVHEMENKSFAAISFEPSRHGSILKLAYLDKKGHLQTPAPFLRNDAPIAHSAEMPGYGFFLSDELNNIFKIDYSGNVSGHYKIPKEYQRYSGPVEMIYSGGDFVFLRFGKYFCMMTQNGSFSEIHSYGDSGYTYSPYRVFVSGILSLSDESGGGYLICVKNSSSRELMAVTLDENLEIISEKIIGSTHGTFVSLSEFDKNPVIITDDVLRFEDRPYDYEQYYRIYRKNGEYCDISGGDDHIKQVVFDDSGRGYTLFSISDCFLSDDREVLMKRCGYDSCESNMGSGCSDSVRILKGRLKDVKILQTSDGGYLFTYITGED